MEEMIVRGQKIRQRAQNPLFNCTAIVDTPCEYVCKTLCRPYFYFPWFGAFFDLPIIHTSVTMFDPDWSSHHLADSVRPAYWASNNRKKDNHKAHRPLHQHKRALNNKDKTRTRICHLRASVIEPLEREVD
jgi:hypothetical protein